MKLFAGSGAWLGWYYLPIVLLGAALSGIAAAILFYATGRMSWQARLPFGPFLAAATWSLYLIRHAGFGL